MVMEAPTFSPGAPRAYRLAMAVALVLDGMPVGEAATQCGMSRPQLYHVLAKEPAWRERRSKGAWKAPQAFAQGVTDLLAKSSHPLTLDQIHEAFPSLSLRTVRCYIAQMNASGKLSRQQTVTFSIPPPAQHPQEATGEK